MAAKLTITTKDDRELTFEELSIDDEPIEDDDVGANEFIIAVTTPEGNRVHLRVCNVRQIASFLSNSLKG